MYQSPLSWRAVKYIFTRLLHGLVLMYKLDDFLAFRELILMLKL